MKMENCKTNTASGTLSVVLRAWRSVFASALLLCLVVLFSSSVPVALGQNVKGSVRGTVTDEQGAAVPDAEVTISDSSTGFSRSAKTGSDGVYNFPDLPLGTFQIRATHAGFKVSEKVGVVVHASDSLVFNIALSVGTINESVTVEANAIQVETTNGELAGLINGEQVTELPLNGRNYMQLVLSVPGVAAGEGFSSLGKGLKGGSDLSISGGAVDANLWLVDGAHNNDVGSNRTILVFPSVDAIDEFKIERNSYSAQFGQSAGSQISIITKHGGNDFHGDVYYFGRNDKLNTFNTFVKSGCLASGTPCQKNKLRRNDYGYTVGGPVKKDKIFFFWSQEWRREIVPGATVSQAVPSDDERAGNFNDVCYPTTQPFFQTVPTGTDGNPVTLPAGSLVAPDCPAAAPGPVFTAPDGTQAQRRLHRGPCCSPEQYPVLQQGQLLHWTIFLRIS